MAMASRLRTLPHASHAKIECQICSQRARARVDLAVCRSSSIQSVGLAEQQRSQARL